jgi:hypothetical protein
MFLPNRYSTCRNVGIPERGFRRTEWIVVKFCINGVGIAHGHQGIFSTYVLMPGSLVE